MYESEPLSGPPPAAAPSPPPGIAATNTFASCSSSASDTVTGIPIGPAFGSRVVVVLLYSDDGSVCTIGGIPADITPVSVFFWAAAVVPSGTTATVQVGPTATTLSVFGAWSFTGSPGTIPLTLGAALPGATADIDTVAGNVILGLAMDFSGDNLGLPNWIAGIANDGAVFYTDASALGTGVPCRDGSISSPATETVTCTWDGGTAPFPITVLATFGL